MENVGCSTISGWAWNSGSPASTVSVQIWDSSTLVQSNIQAATFRGDVKSALGGAATGNYGFAVNTPAILRDGASHAISIKIIQTGLSLPYVLTNSTVQALSCPTGTGPIGYLENVGCASLSGWAYYPYSPAQSITVQLWSPGPGASGTLLANVTAAGSRPDVAAALGTGFSNYGYSIPIPSRLRTGSAQSISIVNAATGQTLPNANTGNLTSTVTCAPTTEGWLDTSGGGGCPALITGWAWNSGTPSTPLQVDILNADTMQVIAASVTANVNRPDVGQYTGQALHGYSVVTPAVVQTGAISHLSIRLTQTGGTLPASTGGYSIAVKCDRFGLG